MSDVGFSILDKLRHPLGMQRVDVAVGVENQFPAVSVALPLGNHLYVDTALNCTRDKHSTQ